MYTVLPSGESFALVDRARRGVATAHTMRPRSSRMSTLGMVASLSDVIVVVRR